jgi:MFS-type transporter involved in bile tolerance (Atg22 family)
MRVSTDQDQKPRLQNVAYAAVAGQVGCTMVILILGAMLLGLWLDAQFGVKGPFTIILLLLSIPISLYLVLRISLRAVRAIQPPAVEGAGRAGNSGMKEE